MQMAEYGRDYSFCRRSADADVKAVKGGVKVRRVADSKCGTRCLESLQYLARYIHRVAITNSRHPVD